GHRETRRGGAVAIVPSVIVSVASAYVVLRTGRGWPLHERRKLLCRLQAISIARAACSIADTMVRKQLAEWQWMKVSAFLAGERGAGRPARNDRNFIEAVLWWRRTGVPWRDLPSEFGPWKTVFSRFDRWSRTGKWQRLFAALRTDVDTEWHSIDSTINRAHQHAGGGKGGARCRRSAGRAAARRRRCISSSMHSGYRPPS